MATSIVLKIREELQENADEKTKSSFQRFFKEEVKYHGVKTHLIDKVAKEYFTQIKDKSKEEIFSLCEELLKSGYCEEAWIAADWAYYLNKDYKPEDFKIFENWIEKYIDNWAECDTLCNHALGDLINQYPKLISKLKQWTKSKNRWMKRAAAVSLILPARNGKFLKDILKSLIFFFWTRMTWCKKATAGC